MSNGYEENRLDFLKKLGLTLSVSLIPSVRLSAIITDDKETIPLTPEMVEFMDRYEHWMDEYIEVIRKFKHNADDMANNANMIRLCDVAKEWQPALVNYMKDTDFARYYMIATERMTKEI
jgi:hypothetical protein